jgi:hypothetical protein
MAKKPMTQFDRERLRLAREAKRGRTTLVSYDSVGWRVSLERVLSGDHDPLPEFFGDPRVGVYSYQVPFPTFTRLHDDTRIVSPVVQVSYNNAEQQADLIRAFGSRTITRLVFAGPGTYNLTAIPVFPAYPILQLFTALWPTLSEWRYRAHKYLTGYTQAWIDNNEGGGNLQPTGSELLGDEDNP